jgi:hypothetical protein
MRYKILLILICILILLFLLIYILNNKNENYSQKKPMTILIKFPSRSRPDKLISTFQSYISKANNPSYLKSLISLDKDDPTVTEELCNRLKNIHHNVTIHIGESKGKIGAVNRDMEYSGNYDILLLASDDMIPVIQGYDDIIRNNMEEYYPDTDGVLWYNDGFQGKKLNTLCILGKLYYKRFGYIYHPSYKSLYCDNEFMEVANMLNKQTYFDLVIIKHEHPDATGQQSDPLYEKNQVFLNSDYNNFINRKSKYFYLT